MITTKEIRDVMKEVLDKRGFIVLGQPPDAGYLFKVGDTTRRLFQFDLGEPYVVIATCGYEDWVKQGDLIAQLRPQWNRLPSSREGHFVRVFPEQKNAVRKDQRLVASN